MLLALWAAGQLAAATGHVATAAPGHVATAAAGNVAAAAPDPLAAARQEVESLVRASGAEVAVAMQALDGRDELLLRPDDPFHAASTMKVAVMIALYAQARAGRLGLEDRLPIKNSFPSLADGSPFSLEPGSDSDPEPYQAIGGTMTLRRLCEAMITKSSNLATNLLIERLGVGDVRQTVHDLGADGVQVLRGVEDGKAYAKGLNNTTTARGLLTLLEKIARGEAVDAGASGEMIGILKGETFSEAIPAGLPQGTPVAHKTGSITRIHHDAAIVFAPRPFALVILVRGLEDHAASATLIAEITRVLYRATQ